MIILFWFIISCSGQINDAVDKAQQAQEDAAAVSARAETLSAEYTRQLDELSRDRRTFEEEMEVERARLYDANERTARNVAAMHAFESGSTLRFVLLSDGTDWYIEIRSGDELLAEVKKGTDIEKGIDNALQGAGFSADDVMLVQFLYDSRMPGSKNGHDSVAEAVRRLEMKYNFLYMSHTDITAVTYDRKGD